MGPAKQEQTYLGCPASLREELISSQDVQRQRYQLPEYLSCPDESRPVLEQVRGHE